MATLVKQSGRYYSQFFNHQRKPKRKRVALKTKTKRVAEQLHREFEDKYAQGEFDPWTGYKKENEKKIELPNKLGELIDLYITDKSREDWRSQTARNTGYILRAFGKYIGSQKDTRSILPNDFNRYLNQEKFAYETKRSHKSKLMAFARWAKTQQVFNIDYTEIKIFNSDNEQAENISYLSRVEIEQLKRGIEKIVNKDLKKGSQKKNRNALWLIDFIDWQRWTGMRISETLNLRVEDINTNDWIINIGSKHFTTKSKVKQVLPISEVEPIKELCLKLLQRDRELDERIFSHKDRSQVTRLFKKYLRKVLPNREDITVHSLRHTCCIELLRAGVPIYTVQRWLRHADVKTTQRYADLLNMDISEQVGKAIFTLKS